MRLKALVASALLSWTAAAIAEEGPSAFKFELHGFASGTVYAQDANFILGGGQGALWILPQTAAAKAQDKWILGGDVRQTRLTFSVAGPTVWNAVPKGVVEVDFFGQFGSGPYGDVSLSPRMRLAYAELLWTGRNSIHQIQVGQNNDLVIGMIPVSLAHIAFPVAYGSGTIGWRRPGIWGYHTFGDATDKDATKLNFAWTVGRSQWNDSGSQLANCAPVAGVTPASATCSVATVGNGIGQSSTGSSLAGGSGDIYGNNLGANSGLPSFQARLSVLGGQNYSAWVTGYWSRVKRSGTDISPTLPNGGIDLDTVAGVVGAKGSYGPLTLAGTVYTGKNLGSLVAAFIQFQPLNRGDVHEWGGWAQAGWNFTKQLSLWGYIGTEQLNRNEARDAGFTVLGNVASGGMLQFRNGGWAAGLEVYHWRTTTVVPASTATVSTAGWASALEGNQVLLSGNYFF